MKIWVMRAEWSEAGRENNWVRWGERQRNDHFREVEEEEEEWGGGGSGVRESLPGWFQVTEEQ